MKLAIFPVMFITFSSLSLPSAFAGADTDNDGVADGQDQCSQTPAGANAWKTGPWTGCTAGQRRDADLAAAIQTCETRADDRMASQHVYEGSGCSGYAYQINQVTAAYIALAKAEANRSLASLGNGHLLYRLDFCTRTDAAVAQTIAYMQRSGCDAGSGSYPSYDDNDNYGGGSAGPGNTQPASGSPSDTTPSSSQGSSYGGGYTPGTTYTNAGNVTVGSDGTVYTQSGNVTVGSNGTVYTTSGNVTVDSNGNVYTQTGNVTVGSNGTVCVATGTVTTCN